LYYDRAYYRDEGGMSVDPMVTKPAVEAYVYRQQPLDPRTLKLLGEYASEVLAEMQAPYGEGPMTLLEHQRAEQLRAFSGRLAARRWHTAQDFFDAGSPVVFEDAP
jgi:hypothetical protein